MMVGMVRTESDNRSSAGKKQVPNKDLTADHADPETNRSDEQDGMVETDLSKRNTERRIDVLSVTQQSCRVRHQPL